MPKETGVRLWSGRSPASPYPSITETDKNKNKNKNKIRLIKLGKSVYDKKVMEEDKCSICMEPPQNIGVILLCSNFKEGCCSYSCTIYPHSNRLNQFLKSPASTSCPLCGGKLYKKWIQADRNFKNSIPRSCSVETCEYTGNYLELQKHAMLEHRDFEDTDLIALGSDFKRVVAVNEGHHH